MLIMEHLCVVCAIEYVMATFLKPELLKFNIYSCQNKSNCYLELNVSWCHSLIDNLVLVLAIDLLEIAMFLIFGFLFFILLQFFIIN